MLDDVSTKITRGESQEEAKKKTKDTSMVLWDVFLGLSNLIGEEAIEKIHAHNKYNLKSKGHVPYTSTLYPWTSTSNPQATSNPSLQNSSNKKC
jgi:hypothetical protein